MKVRLVCADNHGMILLGLHEVTKGTRVEIVGEARGGHDAVELVRKLQPDVVLLDVHMPKGDGMEALKVLRKEFPRIPVLMMSVFDNPSFVTQALELGSSGYLSKSLTPQEIIKTIEHVADGGSAWTREDFRRISGAMATARLDADIDAPLTEREAEVLRQVATGATNKQIAEVMAISYETVKEHVQHILNKIGLSDRTQAAVWAVRRNLA